MDDLRYEQSPRRRTQTRGFTLIETALATVIVGVGVLSMISAQVAFHKQNAWSTHASIAERLGNEIREMTLHLPRHDPVTSTETWGPEVNEIYVEDYDDVDDFDGDGDGLIFSAADNTGPINGMREVISNMPGWSQIVTVESVDPYFINDSTAIVDASTNMVMVTVVVTYQGLSDPAPEEITTVSWIVPN